MTSLHDSTLEAPTSSGAPQHGERGYIDQPDYFVPPALTLAISRETGARGSTIGKRVGRRLGWTFFDQELLQYLAQQDGPENDLSSGLSPGARSWLDEHLERVRREGRIGKDVKEAAVTRIIFTLAAKGQAIIVGRGAGALLPTYTVLHVRIVAPLADRIAWIRQLHRFTSDQATEFIQRQDRRRANVLDTHFRRPSKDPALYDLVLNSSRLGELGCEQLIALAVEQKRDMMLSSQGPAPGVSAETLD
jgi:cytidylate kinase